MTRQTHEVAHAQVAILCADRFVSDRLNRPDLAAIVVYDKELPGNPRFVGIRIATHKACELHDHAETVLCAIAERQ